MVEEEDTQRLAAAPGSRSTVSKCKVKQSRRHNFDTTPSAFAHGNDGSAGDGLLLEVMSARMTTVVMVVMSSGKMMRRGREMPSGWRT